MDLKALLITLCLNLDIAFAFPVPLKVQLSDPRKELFLKKLSNSNPVDIVYVFDGAELEEWSINIYRVFAPVYSINLSRKGCLFRGDSMVKDNDTVLNNENLYIASMSNFSSFKNVVNDIRQLMFWKSRHRIVFITRNDTGATENIIECFRYCFKFWMVNIAIVFINNLEVAYTYNPFEGNYFIQRNISEIFLDKTLNLFGFRLNVTMFPENSTAKKINGSYEGIDGWMSRAVLDKINATYEYVVPSDGAVFGGFNETAADGALGEVLSEKTQVAFNSRFFRERLYKVVEITYSHRRNDLVVLVPIEKAPTLKNIFAMTSPLTWVLILLLSAILYLYFHISNNQLDFGVIMTVIVLIVTARPVHEHRFDSFRIIFMSAMVLLFYLTVEFNCRLTSVLTISIAPPGPSTLDELWETTQYKIKSRPSFARYLSVYVNPSLGDKLMQSAEGLERGEQIQEIMECKKEIIICKHDIAVTAMKRSLIKNRVICYKIMKEIFLPSVQAYIVPYGSPFLSRFDVIIQRLHHNGIFGHWEGKARFHRKHRSDKKPYRLSLDTLFVAFVVLGVGLLTSTLVFLYEYRSGQNKNP